jgi:hypothetical protein
VRYCASSAVTVPYGNVLALKLAALNPSILGGA